MVRVINVIYCRVKTGKKICRFQFTKLFSLLITWIFPHVFSLPVQKPCPHLSLLIVLCFCFVFLRVPNVANFSGLSIFFIAPSVFSNVYLVSVFHSFKNFAQLQSFLQFPVRHIILNFAFKDLWVFIKPSFQSNIQYDHHGI